MIDYGIEVNKPNCHWHAARRFASRRMCCKQGGRSDVRIWKRPNLTGNTYHGRCVLAKIVKSFGRNSWRNKYPHFWTYRISLQHEQETPLLQTDVAVLTLSTTAEASEKNAHLRRPAMVIGWRYFAIGQLLFNGYFSLCRFQNTITCALKLRVI